MAAEIILATEEVKKGQSELLENETSIKAKSYALVMNKTEKTRVIDNSRLKTLANIDLG